MRERGVRGKGERERGVRGKGERERWEREGRGRERLRGCMQSLESCYSGSD